MVFCSLVDDEPDILEIIGYNLSQEGYQIVTAKNGREAISKAKKELGWVAEKGIEDMCRDSWNFIVSNK